MNEDERWMNRALALAEQAAVEEEIPVGAIAVREGLVIGRGYNRTEALQDPTAHAEILAITSAANAIGSRRLEGVTLYVTLEPCCMCAGALVLARIERLVFGAWDPKAGACGTLYNIPQDQRLNHCMEVTGGILEDACSLILSDFFRSLRSGSN
ncbi:tRNA adenosine(34) deaminase TadA [candidate division LCP-89 bacterium B3_LCP]|uniref:tRNA-specific adenosine deaminase n=1 Tax=candidate division LCP-89 bacterium B3_LCP TaxID=2012998 RepID=A0A532V0P8_UNCL8|nr:MAG: tRNA adenosine(34) deaminase TadA [candidate division LCP-89 bacterium B3_LCP]